MVCYHSKRLLLLGLFIPPGWCQSAACLTQEPVNLTAPIPYFQARFPAISFKAPVHNPFFGGQNLTYCCIKAINDYLENDCQNSSSVRIDERLLGSGAQFPCGASFIGDSSGAPLVQVTYGWSQANCPGWELSQGTNSNQWAQLLVGFILPAVVFSFNVPRPRKLKVPNRFFPSKDGSYWVVLSFLGILGTGIIVLVDSICWLLLTFSFAGPMLLSGLYEAQLDKRVIECLQDQKKFNQLPLGLRARMLYCVLCGNLEIFPAYADTMDLAKDLDAHDQPDPLAESKPVKDSTSLPVTNTEGQPLVLPTFSKEYHPIAPISVAKTGIGIKASEKRALGEVEEIDPLTPHAQSYVRNASLATPTSVENKAPQYAYVDYAVSSSRDAEEDIRCPEVSRDVKEAQEGSNDSTESRAFTVESAAARLEGMLECQNSFGSTIGGPVVFFLGSFIYALLLLKQELGDENIAESLAFGLLWMILPHVATVAGLLLAGNNPNILKSSVAIRKRAYNLGELLGERHLQTRRLTVVETLTRIRSRNKSKDQHSQSLYHEVIDATTDKAYETKYNPSWMWNRGRSKQDWLLILFVDSWSTYNFAASESTSNAHAALQRFLVDSIMLSFGDWIFLWTFAFLLLFIPCLFGFLIAYYTPQIGVACRSCTFLVYMIAQTILLIYWAYHLTWRDPYWRLGHKIKRAMKSDGVSLSQVEDLIYKLKERAVVDTKKDDAEIGRTMNGADSGEGGRESLSMTNAKYPTTPSRRVFEWAFFAIFGVFAFGVSLFSGVAGTLMEVIGVYRNCLCLMTIDHWISRDRERTFLTLSTNTFAAIHSAEQDWNIIGVVSIIFLGAVCYIGWWYQRRLRSTFRSIARKLGD